ncbi:MAG TPA: hypothetical protein DCM08_04505 [Microscillaceae bacterium]|nr:hypothetical protein [Microscillaceae bacterium]
MRKINFILPVMLAVFFVSFQTVIGQNIRGTVTDENGEALTGASVLIQGTAKGALVNLSGGFEISGVEPGEYVLVASFIGYKTTTQYVTVVRGVDSEDVNFVLASDLLDLDAVVVTGTFNPQSKLESTVSVSTLDQKLIDQQAPRSTGDLIDVIPGFYVESNIGEGANNVYPRGLPIGTGGFRYTGLREDGLPNFEIQDKVFFNADGFTKVDITLDRVEGLRGGNAAIYSSNTPAGIVNFITKTGGPELAGEFRVTYGTQGMYRVDANVGGPLTADKKWRFNVGGFYRFDQGLRNYTQGPANLGGQIKFNITRLFDNDRGYIRFYGKVLEDQFTVWGQLPYQNLNSPTEIGGISLQYGSLIPSNQGTIQVPDPYLAGANFRYIQMNNQVAQKYRNIGLELARDLGSGWFLKLQARYMTGQGQANLIQQVAQPVGFAGFPGGLTALFSGVLQPGAAGIGLANAARVGFGLPTITGPSPIFDNVLLRYANPDVNSGGLGRAINPTGGTVLYDGPTSGLGAVLNGSNIGNFSQTNGLLAGNGLLMPTGLFIVPSTHNNFISNLQISKTLGGHSLTGGLYFSQYNSNENWSFNTIFTELASNPRLVDMEVYSSAAPTQRLSVIESGVQGANGTFFNSYSKNYTAAVFIGDDWKIGERFNLSLGFRYEFNRAEGALQNSTPATPALPSPALAAFSSVFAGGGLDGNPFTLYDNLSRRPNNSFSTYNIGYEVWNATLGANYRISDNSAIFGNFSRGTRYSNTQNFISNLVQTFPGVPDLINLRNPIEQILQAELGYRLSSSKVGVTFAVFGTDLTNTPVTLQTANPVTNAIQLQALTFDARVYGAEAEVIYSPVNRLRFSAVISAQRGTYTRYDAYTVPLLDPNTLAQVVDPSTGPQFETVNIAGNTIERIPPIQIDLTGDYTVNVGSKGKLNFYVNWRYIGQRVANRRNTFNIPHFSELGAGFSYTNGNYTLAVQGINLLNSRGITEINTRVQDFFTNQVVQNPNLIQQGLFLLPRSANISLTYRF